MRKMSDGREILRPSLAFCALRASATHPRLDTTITDRRRAFGTKGENLHEACTSSDRGSPWIPPSIDSFLLDQEHPQQHGLMMMMTRVSFSSLVAFGLLCSTWSWGIIPSVMHTKNRIERIQARIGPCRVVRSFQLLQPRFPVALSATVENPRTNHDSRSSNDRDNDDEDDDRGDTTTSVEDELLLQQVPLDQLQSLCQQLRLDDEGSKPMLLKRLRQYAQDQVTQETSRRELYTQRVQDGFGTDPKERYELVDHGGGGPTTRWKRAPANDDLDEDDDDDEFFIYYDKSAWENGNTTTGNTAGPPNTNQTTTKTEARRRPAYLTQAAVTAPPMPPDLEPNDDGERVVTIYSTTEPNDLTGIQASDPGPQRRANTQELLEAAVGGQTKDRPWEMDSTATSSSSHTNRRTTNDQDMETATAQITDLVQSLLAQSGAPAFRAMLAHQQDDDDNDLLGTTGASSSSSSFPIPTEFVGFDPTQVPTNQLASASKYIRTGRGQVLETVLREFEIQAIGQDGMAGDNRDKGGGHYREVSKVRAFLQGYRKAQVRRLARETTTLLLDKLVQEGVEGLDLTLASMTRSSDDTSDFAGELNDSLLDFLNDAIRQQEKKVEQVMSQRRLQKGENERRQAVIGDDMQEDSAESIDQLWNVTTENGERVESIDPNDPMVKRVLAQELQKQQDADAAAATCSQESIVHVPESPAEKLLLLLTLLRDRLQAEAAFAPDGKGRSLRLLAYCLRISSSDEREQLLSKELGGSLDVSYRGLSIQTWQTVWSNNLTLSFLSIICGVFLAAS